MPEKLLGPPVPRDMGSYRKLLDFSRKSLVEARKLNKKFEFTYEPIILHEGRVISSGKITLCLAVEILRDLLFLACIVTVFITRGVVLFVLIGSLLVSHLLFLWMRRRWVAARRQWANELNVFPAAVIVASENLFESPEESSETVGSALLVFSEKKPFVDDPGKLVEVADKVHALAVADPEELTDELKPVHKYVSEPENRVVGEKMELPAHFAGGVGVRLGPVTLEREDLPRGVLDHRVWLVGLREGTAENPVFLPAKLWWDPSNDHLLGAFDRLSASDEADDADDGETPESRQGTSEADDESADT